jgi:hypothetical protein
MQIHALSCVRRARSPQFRAGDEEEKSKLSREAINRGEFEQEIAVRKAVASPSAEITLGHRQRSKGCRAQR